MLRTYGATRLYSAASVRHMAPYPRDFITRMQRKVAVSAIPASALRGQGAAGVVCAARDFLSHLRLEPFCVDDARAFARHLETKTRSLCDRLPRDARAWGTARKALNLFLRDAMYNAYLLKKLKLGRMETFLEVPLDSYVSQFLKDNSGVDLPRWPGVRALDPSVSAAYQAAAADLAKRRGMYRVHLDIYIWADPDRDLRT